MITKVELGDTLLMKCGYRALITKINNNNTITVKMDDGETVYNVNKEDFINRTIQHPYNKKKNQPTNKFNEIKMMNCGMNARIINYRTDFDLDVEFEDKTIIYNVTYYSFNNGLINNPNYTLVKKQRDERLHMIKIMKCGLKAKIIKYRSASNIDVLLEDGSVIKEQSFEAFKVGRIKPGYFSSSLKAETFYDFSNLSFSFVFNNYVFYCCTTPEKENKILTLQQMMEQSNIKPVLL